MWTSPVSHSTQPTGSYATSLPTVVNYPNTSSTTIYINPPTAVPSASYAANASSASVAVSASYAPFTQTYQANTTSASYASSSVSSSHSQTASYYNQLWLNTGSLYPITSSWAETASVSTTSSYALTASSADTFELRQYISFNATASVSHSEGRVFYDTNTHTLNVYNDRSNVTLNVGEENWVRIVNKTGVTISNGAVLTISGSQGNRPKAILAQSHLDSDIHNVHEVIGVATEDIIDNDEGMMTVLGIVRGIDTSVWNTGDTLYVSSSAGLMTNIKPSYPYDIIKVGITLNSTNNGSIFVHPLEPVHVDDISGGGSLQITSSRAISSSYALNSLSASYAPGGQGSVSSSYLSGSFVTNNATFATASTFLYGSGSVVAHRTALKILQLTPAAYAALSGSTDAETLYIVTE